MPLTYHVDRDAGLIETKGTGGLSFEEVLDHLQQLEADASLPERLDVLLDLSEVTSLPESEQLRDIAGKVGRIDVAWGFCAIVASRDALFGMLRVFTVLAEQRFLESRVFREREQAERWLSDSRSIRPTGR